MDGGSRTIPFLIWRAMFRTAALPGEDMRGPAATAKAAGSTNLREMKLTSMVMKSGCSASRRDRGCGFGLLQRHDLRLAAQMRMKLAGADVDRVDAPRAAGEKHLVNPPVEAPHQEDRSATATAKTGERAIKLDAAPRYPRKSRCGRERRIDRDSSRTRCARAAVRRYQAPPQSRPGLGAALEHAAFDEKDIGALARWGRRSGFHSIAPYPARSVAQMSVSKIRTGPSKCHTLPSFAVARYRTRTCYAGAPILSLTSVADRARVLRARARFMSLSATAILLKQEPK